MLKKIFKGGGDISSVDTESYYKRFMEFVSRIIVVWRRWSDYEGGYGDMILIGF